MKRPRLIFDHNYCMFWKGGPVRALLDELKPDVVETSSPWRPAEIVGQWRGDALKIFFAHNDNMGAYPLRWFERFASPAKIEEAFGWYTRHMARFLQDYDAFVTNGPALAKRYSARGLSVHYSAALGIDRGFFSPDLRDERLRAALIAQCGLPADAHLLLGLGRHHPEKRWPMVVDAVEAAGAERPVGLILFGTGNGASGRRLLHRIADSPHIHMFRPVYDRLRLAQIMASCDALIHGAEAEPFGLVACEAMASGLPLIVPDTGGCAEIAEPPFAETYRAKDARSAADAIHRLFEREPTILRAAARHASTQVRTDREHVVDLIAYYQRLLSGEKAEKWAA